MSNLPEGLVSGDFFFSLVRTCERAASAAALCDDRLVNPGLCGGEFDDGEELNADDNAAKASALCLGPP